jgi:FGGY-family pentulose kinase/HAD superfamily hydrolase (TIGR01509 family)
MAPVRLIIFDCDGVLIDSEPLAMRVLLNAIEKAGVRVDPDAGFRNYLGRSFSSIAQSLSEHFGIALDAPAIEAMRLDLYETYRRELKPMAGLLDILPAIGTAFCVASSSQMDRIRTSLEITGLMQGFGPRLFSAAMVPHGKPAPDLFLLAAREMGVAPAECLVIEDSPAGIIAAKKAGMRVFAFTGGSHIEPSGLGALIAALRPDASFADMRELPALLAGATMTEGDTRRNLLVAVDVGTGSARAGVLDATGVLLARAEHPIAIRRSGADVAEHDSTQIWTAVCASVRDAVRVAGIAPSDVAGISFDATCSLVVRDGAGEPLAVGDGGAQWDTIAWLDHRAQNEAAECTATGHAVLATIGGVMSPEMEVPKLMWLKRHLPQTWGRAGYFFDLADFLAWTASGSTARSQCTLTCKWTWLGHAGGWQDDFLEQVGLADMRARGALPDSASPVGTDLGPLLPEAAKALGLTEACRVGLGLIDAHAGALGALGAFAGDSASIHRHLALIAGTSSCVMALSPDPRPISGVWGPYRGAVLPDTWLNEAGQSATGALLDHLLRWHGAGGEPTPELHHRVIARIGALRARDGIALGHRLHVLPDFHGNRSPLADPRALGVISGLDLDSDFDSLCRLYWRAAIGIALGVRHILETLNGRGYAIGTLHVTGGHTHNSLLMELYADVTGCTVIELQGEDATLLGTAMVAATAAGLYGSLNAAAMAMQREPAMRLPDPAKSMPFDRDYRIYLTMLEQRRIIDAMAGDGTDTRPTPLRLTRRATGAERGT